MDRAPEAVEGSGQAVAQPAVPETVALIGLGPSTNQYFEFTKRLGGRRATFDEVWGVNAIGDILACDRVFLMDDVLEREAYARMHPHHGVAVILEWLKTATIPVYTSRAVPQYPCLVPYPLEDVLKKVGTAYFNTTPAYAIAYALYLGVKSLFVYGLDYTFAHAHAAEKGRACVEFWLGMAVAGGIRVVTPSGSSIMDSCVPKDERFYGYRNLAPKIHVDGGHISSVTFNERPIPSDEEIEARERREDRTMHPNPLVAQACLQLDYEQKAAGGPEPAWER